MSEVLDYVLTGTGRSGTKWGSNLLTASGVLCTHERVYGPYGESGPSGGQRADSSWLAVPWLVCSRFIGPETRIVHLVRRPPGTISSLYNLGFWRDGYDTPYRTFAETHLPEIGRVGDEISRAAYWWVHWNAMIERLAPQSVRVRIEDGPGAVLAACGIACARPPRVGRNPLAKTDGPRRPESERRVLTLADIPDAGIAAEVAAAAERYGYNLEDAG